jgi:hypothetical protein
MVIRIGIGQSAGEFLTLNVSPLYLKYKDKLKGQKDMEPLQRLNGHMDEDLTSPMIPQDTV